MKITFITFNYGKAGKVVNGPGMCLVNLVSFLEKHTNFSIKTYSYLPSSEGYSFKNKNQLLEDIKNSDVVHHWSGMNSEIKNLLKFAANHNKKIIIGPNVIDTVEFEKEREFLRELHFHRILSVNERLKHRINKNHKIKINSISNFIVGPDTQIWTSSNVDNGKILWKGNSKQFVKDINFGLEVSKKLKKYNFDFLGYPQPYDYFKHITEARQYHLYFTTSLSETMGLATLEQLSSSIPAITHPKIFMGGINYQTGIITNRDLNSYCEAIEEIMENETLYQHLKVGARKFIDEHFSSNIIVENYLKIIKDVQIEG